MTLLFEKITHAICKKKTSEVVKDVFCNIVEVYLQFTQPLFCANSRKIRFSGDYCNFVGFQQLLLLSLYFGRRISLVLYDLFFLLENRPPKMFSP